LLGLSALEEVLNFGAGDLRAEAAPVDVEAVVVAGQKIHFVRHFGFCEGLVQEFGLLRRNETITGAKNRNGGRSVRADVIERGQSPVAFGKLLGRAADVFLHRGMDMSGLLQVRCNNAKSVGP